jgi:hypothetical protein
MEASSVHIFPRCLQNTNRGFLSLDLVQSIDPDGNSCIPDSWDLLVLGAETRIVWRRISCLGGHSCLPTHLSNIIDISGSQINRWTKSKLFFQLRQLPAIRELEFTSIQSGFNVLTATASRVGARDIVNEKDKRLRVDLKH